MSEQVYNDWLRQLVLRDERIDSLIKRVQKLEITEMALNSIVNILSEENIELEKKNKRYREYLGRLQRTTKRYPAEDMAYVVNKITNEALEES